MVGAERGLEDGRGAAQHRLRLRELSQLAVDRAEVQERDRDPRVLRAELLGLGQRGLEVAGRRGQVPGLPGRAERVHVRLPGRVVLRGRARGGRGQDEQDGGDPRQGGTDQKRTSFTRPFSKMTVRSG